MNKKAFFSANDVEEVANKIQEIVETGETLYIMFPFYSPTFDLNTEYDVIGRTENQILIAEKLKEKNIDSIRVNGTEVFVFFPNTTSIVERKIIRLKALSMANWYNMMD